MKPLVKWVGGKRKLAPGIVETMPASISRYCEPFAGGAAVFCELWNQKRFTRDLRFVLTDANADMIALYRLVQEHPERLIDELMHYQRLYAQGEAEALYYRERTLWNEGQHTPSRFVFLKQTAFNGLWRVNKHGKLNAAWGKYEVPTILDEENLWQWHEALQYGAVFAGDAMALLPQRFAAGAVVYLDPPYVGTFDGYTSEGFGDEQQRALLCRAAVWSADGAYVGYSNSADAERLVVELWPCASRSFVTTSYTINRDPNGRDGKRELFAYARSA